MILKPALLVSAPLADELSKGAANCELVVLEVHRNRRSRREGT